ncbi:MAG: Pr6Pr family membrane protein, partial [Prevotellaceae bacterium]|nr:Pr6Pr family membrane protein [Prevotellaceae bacterium]
MINNKNTAFIFRLCAAVFALFGWLWAMDTFSGDFDFNYLMKFTHQSNVLAIAMFVVLAFLTWKNKKVAYLPLFQLICVISLMLTMSVYWLLLAPTESNIYNFGNFAVHLFNPLLVMIDYILFMQPGKIKYRYVYLVLIYPIFYLCLTTAAGFAGYVYQLNDIDGLPEHFPYFFLDFDRLGASVFVYVSVLLLVFVGISHIFYFADKYRAKH